VCISSTPHRESAPVFVLTGRVVELESSRDAAVLPPFFFFFFFFFFLETVQVHRDDIVAHLCQAHILVGSDVVLLSERALET
jgi:hypothetical protein